MSVLGLCVSVYVSSGGVFLLVVARVRGDVSCVSSPDPQSEADGEGEGEDGGSHPFPIGPLLSPTNPLSDADNTALADVSVCVSPLPLPPPVPACIAASWVSCDSRVFVHFCGVWPGLQPCRNGVRRAPPVP